MARFDNGWVKIWRLHQEHWLERDRFTKMVLMTLVEWANYQDSPPNSKIVLKKGQVATSAIELSKVFRIGRQRIRTSLRLLQDASVINQSTNHLGTIITICNYDKYQSNEKELTTPLTNSQPASNQPLTTSQPLNKEVKQLRSKEVKNNTGDKSPTAVAVTPVKNFIARYCEVYKAKYSTNPVIDGRASGVAKRVTGAIGENRAIELIEAFLEMSDQWFVKKKHDLFTFEQNLNGIELFAKTGKQITNNQAQQIEISDQNRTVIEGYFRDKEAL